MFSVEVAQEWPADSSLIMFGLLFWVLLGLYREIDVETEIGMDFHIQDRLSICVKAAGLTGCYY